MPTEKPNSLTWSPNEFKESQFWYLQRQPNSDYGYIGSKKHFDNEKVLSITLGNQFDDNGNCIFFNEFSMIFCYK